MKKKWLLISLILALMVLASCGEEEVNDTPPDIVDYGINHENCDLSQIPSEWVDSVKSNIKVHYAHTSHGEQLTYGIEVIEQGNGQFGVAIGYSELPTEVGALCIFDGQENETYITPDLYWESGLGMNYTRAVLTNNPSINVSMWCWCTQCDYYDQGQVQVYLDSLSALETEFPNVTFVYFTGNAQSSGDDGTIAINETNKYASIVRIMVNGFLILLNLIAIGIMPASNPGKHQHTNIMVVMFRLNILNLMAMNTGILLMKAANKRVRPCGTYWL